MQPETVYIIMLNQPFGNIFFIWIEHVTKPLLPSTPLYLRDIPSRLQIAKVSTK